MTLMKSLIKNGAVFMLILALALPQSARAVDTVVFLTSGSSWSVPSDWNSAANTIEVIGGGGGGELDTPGDTSGGGGGGAYAAITNLTLTPGASVAYAVGSGGSSGSAGGDTYFCDSTSNCASIAGSAVQVGAKGGAAADTNGNGGAGGSGSSSI